MRRAPEDGASIFALHDDRQGLQVTAHKLKDILVGIEGTGFSKSLPEFPSCRAPRPGVSFHDKRQEGNSKISALLLCLQEVPLLFFIVGCAPIPMSSRIRQSIPPESACDRKVKGSRTAKIPSGEENICRPTAVQKSLVIQSFFV